MKPDIILDIGLEFKNFKKRTELVPHHEDFVAEVIDSVLEHIYSETEAEANLEEYAVRVKEDLLQMQDPFTEAQAEAVSQAVREFALVMFQQLRDHGAYNDGGEFTYKLGEFIDTGDFTLTPMSPEDFIN